MSEYQDEYQDDQPKDQSKQRAPLPPLMPFGPPSGHGTQFNRYNIIEDKQRTQARLEKLTIADQMLSEATLFPDQHLILRTTLRDLGYDV